MPVVVMEEKLCDGSQPIQLRPFIHQVGGTSGMLVFDDTTLCKPLIERERYFYENIPEELKEFTPEYRGTIEVEVREDSSGYFGIQLPDARRRPDLENCRPSPGQREFSSDGTKRIASTRSQSESAQNTVPLSSTGNFESSARLGKVFHAHESSSDKPQQEILNPWSLKCYKRQLSRLKKLQETNGNNDTHKFILLENVVAQFQRPCILDLKMGTRQYPDDSSEEKKLRKMRRVETSTSSSIGVRICGMQVYQTKTNNFICHNKYYGRSLSVKGFKKALHEFLQNGDRLRTDVIHRIVPKLHHLFNLIEKQDTFRFYSSSLLIMYEGLEQTVDTRLTYPGSIDTDTCSHCKTDSHTASDKCSDQSSSWSNNSPVDVRIIDFAHTTQKGFLADETLHSGPDEGYLFGLENLRKMFLELL